MLDQLRRHATSWLIKAILSAIILSFIFFFGYNQYRSDLQNAQNYIAIVEKKPIPRQKFNSALQVAFDQMKESFKGEPPEGFEQILKSTVLQQMVQEEIVVNFALSLGLTVSPQKISEVIRNNPNLRRDNEFDFEFYQTSFRPYYRNRYGEDFELVVEKMLLREELEDVARDCWEPWQNASPDALESRILLGTWLGEYQEKIEVEIFAES